MVDARALIHISNNQMTSMRGRALQICGRCQGKSRSLATNCADYLEMSSWSSKQQFVKFASKDNHQIQSRSFVSQK